MLLLQKRKKEEEDLTDEEILAAARGSGSSSPTDQSEIRSGDGGSPRPPSVGKLLNLGINNSRLHVEITVMLFSSWHYY